MERVRAAPPSNSHTTAASGFFMATTILRVQVHVVSGFSRTVSGPPEGGHYVQTANGPPEGGHYVQTVNGPPEGGHYVRMVSLRWYAVAWCRRPRRDGTPGTRGTSSSRAHTR